MTTLIGGVDSSKQSESEVVNMSDKKEKPFCKCVFSRHKDAKSFTCLYEGELKQLYDVMSQLTNSDSKSLSVKELY